MARRFFGSSSRTPSRTISALFVGPELLACPASGILISVPSAMRGDAAPAEGLAISAPHFFPPMEVVGFVNDNGWLATLLESCSIGTTGTTGSPGEECCFFAYFERSRDISSFTTTRFDNSVEFSKSMMIGLLEDPPALPELD